MELEKFDIEKAKTGRKVVTRSWQKVEIIKYDMKSLYPLVGVITEDDGDEVILSFTLTGKHSIDEEIDSFDLFLLPDDLYANLYMNVQNVEGDLVPRVYESLEKAKEAVAKNSSYYEINTYKLLKV